MGRLDEVQQGEWVGRWKTTKKLKKRKESWTVETARKCCFEKCEEKLSNFVKQLWPNGSAIMSLSQVEDAFAKTSPPMFKGEPYHGVHEFNFQAWCQRTTSIPNVFMTPRFYI